MSENRLSSLIDILNYSAKLLGEKGIEDSRLNAELLMAKVLGCSRLELYLNFDKPLNDEERDNFKLLLRRRMKREPLQYILGYADFFKYRFEVDRRVMIPRPETELLVELCIKYILASQFKFVRILEIGTGSGCIAISLSNELTEKKVKHKITATDISSDAISLAEKNSSFYKISKDLLSFEIADVFGSDFSINGYNVIVSNPPYIPHNEFKKLEPELREYEPDISLTDFKGGLSFYEQIFELLGKSDEKYKCFFETGYNQKESLEKIALKNNIGNYIFHKDYNGIFRIMEIEK
jgi:release factor glutamine methyltransferase